ncbi:hypothetical protein AAFN88_06515 [Pelagibius sp. CAU 1746]|uniref:hypothetical protein n=1 Tax=Pelagibius sp. CAU 1746 TaxID=3140370 RepID=UPI00325AD5A5
MTGSLDRDELISLLETLGSDNDEEALAAARVLDTKVKATGSAWAELLSPSLGAEAAESGAAAYDLGDLGDLDELPADAAAKNSESLALIEKLLAKPDNSDEFREELEDYKADIAAGEFTDGDHRYLRALCKRLSA